MKNILAFLILVLVAYPTVAQQSISGIGFAYSRGAPTSDIDNNRIEGNSISIEAGGFDLDRSPMELAMAIIIGNGEEIAFSWEFRTAYIVGLKDLSFFKIGIGAGEMASYKFIEDLGGLTKYFTDEDEERELGRLIISPYLELEKDNANGISFFIRTSWNYYSKSESEYKLIDVDNPDEYKGLFFGGFDASVGLKFSF